MPKSSDTTSEGAKTLDGRPRLSNQDAERLYEELSGQKGTATELPSDRDLNFAIRATDGSRSVLKISNANEDAAFLALQADVMQQLSEAGLPVAKVLGTGTTLLEGRQHAVRLVSWIEGVPLGSSRPISDDLMRDVGAVLARADQVLSDLDGKAAPKKFVWNLCYARLTIEDRLQLLPKGRRGLILHYLDLYGQLVEPYRTQLPHQLVHGDGNDYNILVGPPSAKGERNLTALIDFGDMSVSARITDPAIAAAYLAFHREDPIDAMQAVLSGYHAESPVSELEVASFFVFVALRLCISVCLSAEQQAAEPDNEYLSISEDDAWTCLSHLRDIHPNLAHYRLRAALGWEPVPGSSRVSDWIEQHRHEFAPVITGPDEDAEPVYFDFSVASLEFDPTSLTVPGHAAEALWKATGDGVSIGRWNEPRLAYTGAAYGTLSGERRTVHIGVDLFRQEGTPVCAPLDGIVHSTCISHDQFDYGGCVLLEHRPDEAPVFWTLYGHLSHDSVLQLEKGQRIRSGEAFVQLGAFEENGGWVPHLHFQIVTDRLDLEGTFPGVAAPSQLATWLSLSPSPKNLLGLDGRVDTPPRLSTEDLMVRRREHISSTLSVSYARKLHIVRGHKQFLFDAEGRAYLDAVNNVPHVGHSNPRVVDALHRQMRTLTTNTRYLHESILDYSERLCAMLPDPLEVCFFVNSGSEANDLALRLARVATGKQDIIVLDGAYHGHLTSLINISPYKFDGAGGTGCPPGTRIVPMPDPYRGAYKGMTHESGLAYAEAVRAASDDRGVAAFIAESVPGCGGQIVPPPGYLAAASTAIREAGGLFIADEVQVGMGRAGSHFWGFQIHETDDPSTHVVPDIVVLGKPIGNGHPLAVVVTTRAISDAFTNGMEYFNTFGGNPASCAVGLAVLDELRDQGLQNNAHVVGSRLLKGLIALMPKHSIMGDVRGVGLYIGVELVRNHSSLEPADSEASYVANRMRDLGILISTDGPLHNVLKIKPPMVFTTEDADHLVAVLDDVLGEDAVQAQVKD